MIRFLKLHQASGARCYRANLGPYFAQAKTKMAARNALINKIAREPNLFRPRVMIDQEGGIWTLFRAPDAWCYFIPSGSMVSMLSEHSEAEAIALFEKHFHEAQHLP